MEVKRPQRAETILRKRNRAGGITLSDFRLKIQSFSNQNIMALAQKQKIDQWNRKIIPCKYGQLIYKKGGNAMQRKKVSSISGAGKP